MIKRDEHEPTTGNDDGIRTYGAADGERSMSTAEDRADAGALGGPPLKWWNWVQLVPEVYFIACKKSGVLETLATIVVALDLSTGKGTESWTVNSAMADPSNLKTVDELIFGLGKSAPTSLRPIPTENIVRQSAAADVSWSDPVTGRPFPNEGTTFYGGEYVYYAWLMKQTGALALNIQTKMNSQGKWQIDRIVWHKPQLNGNNINLQHSPVVSMARVQPTTSGTGSYTGTCVWVEAPML